MARLPELDPLISQYQHEAGRPRAAEALHTLRRIGSVVKPIMRRRGFRVGTLAEFYPSQANLLGLNVNSGQTINLRLRHAGDQTQFLRFEDVVDTMLHELCHNLVGPHNEAFHNLWDQLRDEHEALLRKGYTGEGFLGRGQQLGGGRKLPVREAGRLARQAAEARRARDQGFGHRLGGTGMVRGQDARKVIADAVERRMRTERGCASGTAAGDRAAEDERRKNVDVITTQAGPEDQNEAIMMQAFIDLIEEDERQMFAGFYSPPSAENPTGSRSGLSSEQTDQMRRQQEQIEAELARSTSVGTAVNGSSKESKPTETCESTILSPSPVPLTTWTCEICTLVNPLDYLACDACGIEQPARNWLDSLDRPQKKIKDRRKPRSTAYESVQKFERERVQKVTSRPLGWRCTGCGNFMEAEWWTCASCGRMKENS